MVGNVPLEDAVFNPAVGLVVVYTATIIRGVKSKRVGPIVFEDAVFNDGHMIEFEGQTVNRAAIDFNSIITGVADGEAIDSSPSGDGQTSLGYIQSIDDCGIVLPIPDPLKVIPAQDGDVLVDLDGGVSGVCTFPDYSNFSLIFMQDSGNMLP